MPLLSLSRAREEFSLPHLPSFSLSSPSLATEIISVARGVLSLDPHFTALVFSPLREETRGKRGEERGERRDNVLILQVSQV